MVESKYLTAIGDTGYRIKYEITETESKECQFCNGRGIVSDQYRGNQLCPKCGNNATPGIRSVPTKFYWYVVEYPVEVIGIVTDKWVAGLFYIIRYGNGIEARVKLPNTLFKRIKDAQLECDIRNENNTGESDVVGV